MPSVQVIPASDSYRYEAPKYDEHQFQRHRKRFDLGVAFSDLHNMHVECHKEVQERRLPTPEWATNDVMLRELLVRYMERRALIFKPQAGTLKERLDRAEQVVVAQAPRYKATLKKLLKEYVELKKLGRLQVRTHGSRGRTYLQMATSSVVAASRTPA